MPIGFIASHDGEQIVSLPADTCFPHEVKQVTVRVVGKGRVLSLLDRVWDSFFLKIV